MMAKNDWKVSRWMSTNLKTVAPGDGLADAFELMKENRIRHVPVVDKGKLVGLISDRDLRSYLPTRRQLEEGASVYCGALIDTLINEVMTRRPLTISKEVSLQEAAAIMCREKIGALPICSNGVLQGIVTAEDLLWAFVENIKEMGEPEDS